MYKVKKERVTDSSTNKQAPEGHERKIGAAANLSLKHTADCTAPQSQID